MGRVSMGEGGLGRGGTWGMVVWAVGLRALWLRGRMQGGGGLYFHGSSSATLSGCSIYNNTAGRVSDALCASQRPPLRLHTPSRCPRPHAVPRRLSLRASRAEAFGGSWESGVRALRGRDRLGGLLRVGEVDWGGLRYVGGVVGWFSMGEGGCGEEGHGACSCGLWF